MLAWNQPLATEAKNHFNVCRIKCFFPSAFHEMALKNSSCLWFQKKIKTMPVRPAFKGSIKQ